jgi:hypothetical protein
MGIQWGQALTIAAGIAGGLLIAALLAKALG